MKYAVAMLGSTLIVISSIMVAAATVLQYYFGAPFFIEPIIISILLIATLLIAGKKILQNDILTLVLGAMVGILGIIVMQWTIAGTALGVAGLITFIGAMMGWGIPQTPFEFDPRMKWTFIENTSDNGSGRLQVMTTYKKKQVLFILMWNTDNSVPASTFVESLKSLKRERQSNGTVEEISMWGHKAKMARGTSEDGWHLRQYVTYCNVKELGIFLIVTGEPDTSEFIDDMFKLIRCH